MTQRSLEITQVRQKINDQAELLRFIQQEYLAGNSQYQTIWRQFADGGSYAETKASVYGLAASGGVCQSNLGSNYRPFILDPKAVGAGSGAVVRVPNLGSKDSTTPPYPQIVYNSGGGFYRAYNMWIESVPKSETNGTKFVDFHIRACWDSVGGNTPVTLGTIVRLYEKN